MADLSVMYSSKSDEWATPQSFFDEINNEFQFDLDVCATDENHKCDRYFTVKDNGLEKNWGGVGCSAILHIARFLSGLKRHFTKREMKTLWLSC